jgi:tetratricopeptide (TPR) repeat protein
MLLAGALFLLLLLYYFAKWNFANMVASATDMSEVADYTARIAPGDPQTHFASAVLLEKTFLPEDLQRSLAEYEIAASLAPNNYLYWLELGKARERGGDSVGAEAALARALNLAPSYSAVRWAYGNTLLRQGKIDEGFAQIRTAVHGNPVFAGPAVVIASQIFEGNTNDINRAVGDSPAVRAALVGRFIQSNDVGKAFAVWMSIPEADRNSSLQETGKRLFEHLIAAKRFSDAAKINVGGDVSPKEGVVNNGGFEGQIRPDGGSLFDWNIAPGQQPQVVLSNGQTHTGSQSLLLLFDMSEAKDYRQVSQTVLVEPGRSYTFSAYYKTEMKSAAALRWEISAAGGGDLLGATPPTAMSADWRPLAAAFMAPASSEAVTIKLVLANCTSAICPMTGKVWIDDVSIAAK